MEKIDSDERGRSPDTARLTHQHCLNLVRREKAAISGGAAIRLAKRASHVAPRRTPRQVAAMLAADPQGDPHRKDCPMTYRIPLTLVALLASSLAMAQGTDATVKIDRDFAAMDANKDGNIDRAEYRRFIQERFERQAQALDQAFHAMDSDRNGQVSKAEAAANPIIAGAFDGLDENRDGNLSLAEMRSALTKAQAMDNDTP